MHTHSNETVKVRAEYTDTFAGEANYSWCNRQDMEFPSGISDREVMRQVKARMGITGMRGRTHNFGDFIEFRPYRCATILFISFTY